MDLTTKYMGLDLKNPIVVGSSKLTSTLSNLIVCEQSGAGAVVLKSLFEEQLVARAEQKTMRNEMYFWYPEANDYMVDRVKRSEFEAYLKFVRNAKAVLNIPIIASINCVSPIEWPKYAAKIQDAGADALELNIGIFPFDKNVGSQQIEDMYIEIVQEVKKFVSIPISVKLGMFFTNIHAITHRLADSGTDALVLFNRFYNPDVDIATKQVITDNVFSNPNEKSIPMRWIALLSADKIACDLAASTGIHYATGVAKQLLVGATVTQLCTTLYQNGIPYIGEIITGLEAWMKQNNYKRIDDFRGLLNKVAGSTAGFERIQYLKKDFED